MTELVDDDVVEHLEGREHEPPVERQRPGWGAGAPERALVANLDLSVADAERQGLLVEHHRHELARRAPPLVLVDRELVQPEPRYLPRSLALDPFQVRTEHLVALAVVKPGG